jgi:hypothetical protein
MTTFHTKFLPTVLRAIINSNIEDLRLLELREQHKKVFQPTLDLINKLKKRYFSDDFDNISYIIYSYGLDETKFRYEEETDIDLALYEEEDNKFDPSKEEYDFEDGWLVRDDEYMSEDNMSISSSEEEYIFIF